MGLAMALRGPKRVKRHKGGAGHQETGPGRQEKEVERGVAQRAAKETPTH